MNSLRYGVVGYRGGGCGGSEMAYAYDDEQPDIVSVPKELLRGLYDS